MPHPSADDLTLPFSWTVATRLPTQSWLLPSGALAWPAVGQRLAEFTPVPFDDDASLAETRPALVIAECADLDALRRLLRIVYAHRLAGLAVVHGGVPSTVAAEVLGHTRDFAVVDAPGPRRAFDPDAARTLAEIVRRRVYRSLIVHWRDAYARHLAALAALGDGIPLPLPDLARPVMAPLSTIERVHIDGVLGLWLPTNTKPTSELGVSHGRLRRALSTLPPALVEATAPRKSGTLRALIVEDDRHLGKTLLASFTRHAEREGRTLEVELVTRADAARARIERDGAPELLCVDVGLEDARAGIRLLEWLRRGGAATVVLGKSGASVPESVRALWRLGAYGVWTGEGPSALEREVAALFDALDETAVIQSAAARAEALATELEGHVRRGLVAAELLRRAREARSIVTGLEGDLAELPEGTLQPGLPLDRLREEAGRRALELADGNRTAAARMLGVDVGTLSRLLGL